MMTKNDLTYHTPVLLQKTIEAINIRPDGIYVDATFGGGSHSRSILSRLGNGKLVAFDQDPDAKNNLIDDERFIFIPQNFRYLKNYLKFYGIRQIDGILADLGVSSHQLDTPHRGFSFRFNEPLDMRMNPNLTLTAAEWIKTASESEIAEVLYKYGELKNSGRLAHHIKKAALAEHLNTTQDLVESIQHLFPAGKWKQFMPQVFQAIRIKINDELGALEDLLKQSIEVLKPKGRLVVISYHSLEDRMVKNFMKYGNTEGKPIKDMYGKLITPLKVITKKPITPDLEEIESNPRSRSAKLRVAEKI